MKTPLLLCAVLSLTACGQKGPLYFDTEPQQQNLEKEVQQDKKPAKQSTEKETDAAPSSPTNEEEPRQVNDNPTE